MPSDVGTPLPWNFPFKRSFWRKGSKRGRNESLEASTQAAERLTAAPELAVSINKLRKVFWTTEGASKAAVDGLSVDILKNEITALLGDIFPDAPQRRNRKLLFSSCLVRLLIVWRVSAEAFTS